VLTVELLVNAVVAGLLLGGFLAAASLGISIAFGLLDIVNIAHPVFIIGGSYTAYILNSTLGWDPLLSGLMAAPFFYVAGLLIYRAYYLFFERTGGESLRGLLFFFGMLFLVEVSLIITYGVDYRLVQTRYLGESLQVGIVGLPYRLLIPFAVGTLMTLAMHQYLARTYYGKAITAVSQDSLAVRLMGADPTRIKGIAFGLSLATAAVAGALLIMISPVEPSLAREYIGRVFAISVLGGMGSIGGTLLAAFLIGIAESLTSTFYGPAWAPAVSFGILLLVFAIRPAGLFGR
jgi:branched-chain amino acid transport system permease protein